MQQYIKLLYIIFMIIKVEYQILFQGIKDDKTRCIRKIKFLIQELIKLPQYQYNGNNSEFNKWLRKATRYSEQIFKKIEKQPILLIYNLNINLSK